MYSVFVMWRALVLDRLGKYRLEPEPAQNKHEVRYQSMWYQNHSTRYPGNSNRGTWYPGTRTVVLDTQEPGTMVLITQELWCSVLQGIQLYI